MQTFEERRIEIIKYGTENWKELMQGYVLSRLGNAHMTLTSTKNDPQFSPPFFKVVLFLENLENLEKWKSAKSVEKIPEIRDFCCVML